MNILDFLRALANTIGFGGVPQAVVQNYLNDPNYANYMRTQQADTLQRYLLDTLGMPVADPVPVDEAEYMPPVGQTGNGYPFTPAPPVGQSQVGLVYPDDVMPAVGQPNRYNITTAPPVGQRYRIQI